MADIDHHRCVAAVAENIVESPHATATPSAVSSHDSDDDDGGFTFAAASPLAAGAEFAAGSIGPVYPVFGRPRSPELPDEEEDSSSATVRVPLALLLLEERGSPSPSPSGQPDDGKLDGVPPETYCLWSPGASPARSRSPSPARCSKSGSTGSVLRWRQWLLGQSHGDGKEKFVFLDTRTEGKAGRGHGWGHHGRDAKGGGGNGGRLPFLSYKKDLVGLLANAGALRRSYHPF